MTVARGYDGLGTQAGAFLLGIGSLTWPREFQCWLWEQVLEIRLSAAEKVVSWLAPASAFSTIEPILSRFDRWIS